MLCTQGAVAVQMCIGINLSCRTVSATSLAFHCSTGLALNAAEGGPTCRQYFAGMRHVLAPVQHSLPHTQAEATLLRGAQCSRALRDVTAVTRQEGLTETEMVTPFGKLTSSATMRWRASGVSGAAEE